MKLQARDAKSFVAGLGCAAIAVALSCFLRAHPVGFVHPPSEVVVADSVESVLARPYPDRDPAVVSDPAVHHAFLDRPFPNGVQRRITLEQLAAAVQQSAGVTVRINQKALDAVAIDSGADFPLDVRDATVAQALEAALARAGGGTVLLGYRAEPGRITLTTADDLNSTRVVRVYDVRDLMAHATRVSRTFESIVPTTRPAATDTGRDPVDPRDESQLARDLTDAITWAVAPDSWGEHGGRHGNISYFAGRLVVIQTPDNHEKVLACIRLLRRAFEPGGPNDQP